MDEDKKKPIMIGIAVACIALAIGITLFTSDFGGGGGGGSGANTAIPMLCDSCNATYEVTPDEFRQMVVKLGDRVPMMEMQGEMTFPCQKCGKNTAYRAIKCTKCQNIFVMGDAGDKRYPDKCPKCGHSEIEAMSQKK